jgi:hypothetical protein
MRKRGYRVATKLLFWTTRDGRQVLITDMTDKHLENTVALVDRKMREKGEDMNSPAGFTLNELVKEQRRREALGPTTKLAEQLRQEQLEQSWKRERENENRLTLELINSIAPPTSKEEFLEKIEKLAARRAKERKTKEQQPTQSTSRFAELDFEDDESEKT